MYNLQAKIRRISLAYNLNNGTKNEKSMISEALHLFSVACWIPIHSEKILQTRNELARNTRKIAPSEQDVLF
jgi:hypothetical protein